MVVENTSEYTTHIRLNNGRVVIIMHTPSDELSIAFGGQGHRNLKVLQNRQEDGYSGATFTKQE